MEILTKTKGYSYEVPSEISAKKYLGKYFSEEEVDEMWNEVCTKTFGRIYIIESFEDLEKVYRCLLEKGGIPAVVGRSLIIKLSTYKILSVSNKYK